MPKRPEQYKNSSIPSSVCNSVPKCRQYKDFSRVFLLLYSFFWWAFQSNGSYQNRILCVCLNVAFFFFISVSPFRYYDGIPFCFGSFRNCLCICTFRALLVLIEPIRTNPTARTLYTHNLLSTVQIKIARKNFCLDYLRDLVFMSKMSVCWFISQNRNIQPDASWYFAKKENNNNNKFGL